MQLQRYARRHGDSGLVAYATDPRGIAVQFGDGSVYVYDVDRPGRVHVAEMKRLAKAGEGLSTYISQHVRGNYAEKLR